MSETMLERAARALYERNPYERDGVKVPWENVGDQRWYLDDVRGVLQAIREPSEDILPEFGWRLMEIEGEPSFRDKWQAMIDALLAGPPPSPDKV